MADGLRLPATTINLGVFTAYHKASGDTVLDRTYRSKGAATSALRLSLERHHWGELRNHEGWEARKARIRELEADYEVRPLIPAEHDLQV
ncbi:hypothetical protein M2322_002663 [Rhodoblastus acidophilus]|nr:hypothetical protein [Rhodoblastus acidophilus]